MGRHKKDSQEKTVSANETVSKAIKGQFNLDKFKQSKFLTQAIKFKEQGWIPLSPAFNSVIGLPGIPVGHLIMLRGHSNTGKTTCLLEAAVQAQKMGKLPVFIISEMKWSFEHAKIMGFQVDETKDDKGNISYSGNFLYVDRNTINSIEDVGAFILDLLDEQSKGNLPYDLVFLWDSVGSLQSEMSIKSGKVNNEWNALGYAQVFGNVVNQKIILSRKESNPYTNTLIFTNKIWVEKPANPFDGPKIKPRGGNTMFGDSSLVITFGNISNAGTHKLKATKDGKEVEFASRTKIQVDKNHINGVTTLGKVVATPHGFISDDKDDIDEYKDQHSKEWLQILGSKDFTIIETEESEDRLLQEDLDQE